MPSKKLIDHVATLTDALPAVDTTVPGEHDFDRWASLSTPELHGQITRTRASFAHNPAEPSLTESKFFLALMQWSLHRAPEPFGLKGTTPLLETRMKTILDSRNERGAFTRVVGDQGDRDCLVLFGRFVPIGIYHADLGAVPRSLPTRLSLSDALKVIRCVSLEMRGFGPTLGIHLPKLAAGRLTEEDFVDAHLEAVPLFENNPTLRGFFNSAWYYDPEIARISPHLAFVSRFASEHGSLRFDLGHDADSVADATWKSRTRGRLYEEGSYVPKRYARLWSRRRFLTWARRSSTHD